MKRCPKCNRTYRDDTLRFCLDDGSLLESFSAPRPRSDDEATLRSPPRGQSEAPPTAVLPERVAPTMKSSGPTVPSWDVSSQRREVRQTNPVLTAGVIAIAVLLLALVGLGAFFVVRQQRVNESTQSDRGNAPTARDASPNNRSTPTASNTVRGADEIGTSQPPASEPLKITATASSVRLAVQSNTYYASNAIDGKRSTAWIEGVDGPGIGEWIRFDFDREITLHRILIQPGYFKSPQIWAENNRVAAMTAYFSNGSSRELTFPDRMETQKVDLGAIRTRWVRLVIKSVYYGTDPDTAISEVAFEWEP